MADSKTFKIKVDDEMYTVTPVAAGMQITYEVSAGNQTVTRIYLDDNAEWKSDNEYFSAGLIRVIGLDIEDFDA